MRVSKDRGPNFKLRTFTLPIYIADQPNSEKLCWFKNLYTRPLYFLVFHKRPLALTT